MPCHRVVGASGSLTDYAGLLRLETTSFEAFRSRTASARRRSDRTSRRPKSADNAAKVAAMPKRLATRLMDACVPGRRVAPATRSSAPPRRTKLRRAPISAGVWASAAAFQPNATGTFGNAGYNSLIGPGSFGLDANVSRVFRITERHRAQLRFEFFNALNHTRFNTPVGNLSSANFGRIQSAGDPRILQFALKYSF